MNAAVLRLLAQQFPYIPSVPHRTPGVHSKTLSRVLGKTSQKKLFTKSSNKVKFGLGENETPCQTKTAIHLEKFCPKRGRCNVSTSQFAKSISLTFAQSFDIPDAQRNLDALISSLINMAAEGDLVFKDQEYVGLRPSYSVESREPCRLQTDKHAPGLDARNNRFRAVPRKQRNARSLQQVEDNIEMASRRTRWHNDFARKNPQIPQ